MYCRLRELAKYETYSGRSSGSFFHLRLVQARRINVWLYCNFVVTKQFPLTVIHLLDHAPCSVRRFTVLLIEESFPNAQLENPKMRGLSGLYKPENQRKSRTHEQLSLSVVVTPVKLSTLP